jgi:hypothetical protein
LDGKYGRHGEFPSGKTARPISKYCPKILGGKNGEPEQKIFVLSEL